jgi:hypothetical protein
VAAVNNDGELAIDIRYNVLLGILFQYRMSFIMLSFPAVFRISAVFRIHRIRYFVRRPSTLEDVELTEITVILAKINDYRIPVICEN